MTKTTALLAGLMLAAASYADAPPADAPAGTTGLCKDGSYWSGATKKGACHGHHGVQTWYGSSTTSASGGAGASTPAPASTPPAPPPPPPTSTSTKSSGTGSTKSSYTPPANPAPGGGPGMVWVNSSSKVYHCPGDQWYGKTKHGSYMSEADAKAQGDRPDHGKPCS